MGDSGTGWGELAGPGGLLGLGLEFWGEWVCFIKQMTHFNECACSSSSSLVCWAVDCHCWSSGAWLAIFGVGVAMVQVDGLGVVVAVVGAIVDEDAVVEQ